MRSRFVSLALVAAVISGIFPGVSSAQFLFTGQPTITLDTAGMTGTPMNIAWDPNFHQYYGAGGGLASFKERVWDASGGILQTFVPIDRDVRSLYYNANTNQLEMMTAFANSGGGISGLFQPLLDGNGFYLGTYNKLLNAVPGLISGQTVPAFDSTRNLLYSYDSFVSTSLVNRVDRATGAFLGTTTLNLAAAGNPILSQYAISYDPTNDALLAFTPTGGNRIVAFNSQTGDYLASINLPGLVTPETAYASGFANNQIFVFDYKDSLYHGYAITAVPEPTILAFFVLVGSGVAAFAAWRWRQKQLLNNKPIK